MRKITPYQYKGLLVGYSAIFNWNHSQLIFGPNHSLSLLPVRGLHISTCSHVAGNTSSMWKAKTPFPTAVGLVHNIHFGKEASGVSPSYLFFSLCHENGLSLNLYHKVRRHVEKRHCPQLITTHVQHEWDLEVTCYCSWLQSRQIQNQYQKCVWLRDMLWPRKYDLQ